MTRPIRRQTLPFLSTPSARRATTRVWAFGRLLLNFYPRPPRGGRHVHSTFHPLPLGISIHALREEGDENGPQRAGWHCHFYPRPPRGGRPGSTESLRRLLEFLSTPSARRATRHEQQHPGHHRISIHALREEGDYAFAAIPLHMVKFLSTPSARRATHHPAAHQVAGTISIHALREEGDYRPLALLCPYSNFYPRPPRGGRPVIRDHECRGKNISIHALREEGNLSSLMP